MNKAKIKRAIESSHAMAEASRKLGVDRRTLYRWLEEANLKVVRDIKLKVVEK